MLLIALAGTLILHAEPATNNVLKQVDPFIGTGFHGHAFPGATTPFGMVQLSPDTRTSGWDACGGYYDADKETGFRRGKKQDRSWVTPFNSTDSNHNKREYSERNAWQRTGFAPHDVPGLIDLFGDKEPFAKKLNELFTTDSTLTGDITGLIGQYATATSRTTTSPTSSTGSSNRGAPRKSSTRS